MKKVFYKLLVFASVFIFVGNSFVADGGAIVGIQFPILLYLLFMIDRIFYNKLKGSFFSLFLWVNLIASIASISIDVFVGKHNLIFYVALIICIATLIVNTLDYTNFKETRKELFS